MHLADSNWPLIIVTEWDQGNSLQKEQTSFCLTVWQFVIDIISYFCLCTTSSRGASIKPDNNLCDGQSNILQQGSLHLFVTSYFDFPETSIKECVISARINFLARLNGLKLLNCSHSQTIWSILHVTFQEGLNSSILGYGYKVFLPPIQSSLV